MSDMCTTCGLSQDLCVCENLAKEIQKIEIRLEKKKFQKYYTVVDGINGKDIDIKDLAKQLKEKCACGGTTKDDRIELQGDHRPRVKEALVALGFAPEMIVVK